MNTEGSNQVTHPNVDDENDVFLQYSKEYKYLRSF